MAKKQKYITITGIHRRRDLAERRASALRHEFDTDDVTFTRHDSTGRFSRRGQTYIFRIPLRKPKKMWRIIVGYPYLLNKKKGESPDARTKKAIYYDKTKLAIEAEFPRLKRELLKQIKETAKAWVQENKKHPLYRQVTKSVSEVPYEKRLIGITEFLDD